MLQQEGMGFTSVNTPTLDVARTELKEHSDFGD